MKSIALIGSTGSIGQKTLEIVRYRSDHFRVAALAARKNVERLIQQAKEFRPELVSIFDISEIHK